MPEAEIQPYLVGKRVDISLPAALKPEWRVSMAALLMRARGYWLREPPQLDFPLEEP